MRLGDASDFGKVSAVREPEFAWDDFLVRDLTALRL
jgi:hypothetical protein